MQSDGNTLTILKCGDEWFHYSSTEDGYPLVVNAKGDYEYAILRNNVLVSTGVVAHQNRSTEERAFLKKMDSERISSEAEAAARVAIRQKLGDTEHHRAPNPLFGKRKGLVILVNFKDVKFKSSTAKADFTALLNERGYSQNGATGSANDYFRASTFEKFDPEFVVYGPYDLPENIAEPVPTTDWSKCQVLAQFPKPHHLHSVPLPRQFPPRFLDLAANAGLTLFSVHALTPSSDHLRSSNRSPGQIHVDAASQTRQYRTLYQDPCWFLPPSSADNCHNLPPLKYSRPCPP